MRPLVVTRPEPAASATARLAEDLGMTVIAVPLFGIEAVDWEAPDTSEFDALLLTSANAVRHGGVQLDRLRDLTAHCVGEATAAAAREAGFTIGTTGISGVESLLRSLPDDLRLLHLCGRDRRDPDWPAQSIHRIVVYGAAPIAAPEGVESLEGAVATVHSPRAAARLGAVVDAAGIQRRSIAVVAISPDAAAAAGGGWDSVDAAPEPSDSALLALAAGLCNNPG
jgi:uroporphyrinogen-III synthase